MPPGHLDVLAGVGAEVSFPARHRVFAEDGAFASKFWLIESGHVALDVHVPGEGRVIVDTSASAACWLVLAVSPYRWAFGAVCVAE